VLLGAVTAGSLLLAPARAGAQALDGQPFRTMDAATLRLGEHSIEIGAEYRSKVAPVPILSPVRGDLLQVPEIRWRMGFGRAEVHVAWPAWQSFSPEGPGDEETEVGDASFWVKIGALRQRGGRPALGMGLGAKLPNASNETGLGSDESDVFLHAIVSHAGPRHDVRFNAGVAILGDPLTNASQEDLLTWGLAGRFGERHALLAEVWGRSGDSDDVRELEEATVRLGYGLFLDRTAISLSLLHGLDDNSGDLGAEAGVSWRVGTPRR
jgi:hypothetical protein